MIKNTNWTRLLSEFLVIVVGVLVALGFDEWGQARRDHALEQEYLVRIGHDLERGRINTDSVRLGHVGAARNADFVLPYLAGEAGIPGDTATTLAALYRASRSLSVAFATTFPRSTLSELLATGATLELLPREYRDFIRRRLPTALQLSVRSECPVYETADGGPLACEINLGTYDPGPLLREVSGNIELAGDLNFSRQQLAIGIGLTQALLVRTDSLIALIEAARR